MMPESGAVWISQLGKIMEIKLIFMREVRKT